MSSSNEQAPQRQHPPQPFTMCSTNQQPPKPHTMASSAPKEDITNTFLTTEEMLSPSIRSILEPASRPLRFPSYDSFIAWLMSPGVAPFWTEFERDCLQPLLALKASDPKSFPVQDVPDSAILKPASTSLAEYFAARGKVPVPAHYLTWHFNRYFSKRQIRETTLQKPNTPPHSIPLAALKEKYKPGWKPYQHVLLFFGQVWIRNRAMGTRTSDGKQGQGQGGESCSPWQECYRYCETTAPGEEEDTKDLDLTPWAIQLCYLLDGMTRSKYERQLGVHVKEFAGKRDEGCIISFKLWPDGITGE